ncbi:porin [Breoghania sp. L-A4]|uniref:porin n=1 Tax=Breoghania sp. L-A4 TaxID=2304600 RepID=UPI000E35835A|nr:porin [Breoghania sp. L-A4]AXS40225.1 porin [Breoghania sp. L-A4]
MTIRHWAFAAAAGALATSGAQAADLPIAPEPVDYVRVCDAQGTGFFYIPGTETCLRVGGRVRAEFRVRDFADNGNTNWGTRGGDATTFRARGYVRLDARTETEYGLLRTYVDTWITSDTGAGIGASVILWDAFVQLGGFTAGRTGSFYDFYTGDAWGSLIDQGFADQHTTLFGYTAAFGNGMSASVSVEDGVQRRGNISGTFTYNETVLGSDLNNDGDTADTAVGITSTAIYGGHKLPDFVANLRVDQGWGSAQIMGALHLVNADDFSFTGVTPGAPDFTSTFTQRVDDSAIGWAVGAGVTFNLPMIAAGDSISFQAAYANGAVKYVSSNLATDAVATSATNISTATAWGVGGGFTHFWTPMWSTSASASYASLDVTGTRYDVDQIGAQGNLVWHPVGGLDIGVEVEYLNENFGAGGTDDDDLVALFRVQRTF